MSMRIPLADSTISAMDKQLRFLITSNSTRNLNSLSLSICTNCCSLSTCAYNLPSAVRMWRHMLVSSHM